MQKKSIVKNVQGNGTWEGKFGLMYKYEVEMENGDMGEYSSKSENQNKFIVGQQVDYEYIEGKYPKIKPVNNFQPRANYSNSNSDVQNNIRYAQSLNIANLQYCHGKIEKNQIDQVANEFFIKLQNNGKTSEIEEKTKAESDLPF